MTGKRLEYSHQDARWDLVLRLTTSPQLSGSPRLRDLLLYVADCALRNAPDEVSEQRIGTYVFGRPSSFNPAEDSIVRTQARLLRMKMAAYFLADGAAEPIVVEIPKGHYLPVFTRVVRDTPELVSLHEMPAAPVVEKPGPTPALVPAVPSPQRHPWFAAWVVAGSLALLLMLAAGWWMHARVGRGASPILTLWRPFLAGDPPLVIYSNALFTGDSKTGMSYAPPGTPHEQPMSPHMVDHYTGVGELVSIHMLTRLFDSQGAQFTLKRSLLVTWDEAKLRNLIFVGGAAENSSIRVLPASSDFTMMSANTFAGIVNNHPRPGEPALLTRPEYPLTRDYAIVSLLPGMKPGNYTFVLSGLTTMGTEAAVEFACNKESVAELLRALKYTSGEVRPFEAVLEVSVGGGVPLQSRIIMVHAH